MIPYLLLDGTGEHRPLGSVEFLGSRALCELCTARGCGASPLSRIKQPRAASCGFRVRSRCWFRPRFWECGPRDQTGPTGGKRFRACSIRGSPVRQWDLLRMPILGPILAVSPFSAVSFKAAMLLLAAAVAVDGFFGPQVAPMNLAGVLPWTHWRGLAVIALLMAGNLFCMACPFTLPRDLARSFVTPRYRWPGGYVLNGSRQDLLATYLWAYEAFSLWDSPRATAWIIVGYFVAAFAVDTVFKGASFCKYVCPIGQFHFVHSLVSPLQVKVREPAVCGSCTTHDCIRGNARSAWV